MATPYVVQNEVGIDLTANYTSYVQTTAVSSTNSPDNPGPPFLPGTEVVCTNGAIFMFVTVAASATLALGDVCAIDPLTFNAKPALGGATAEMTKQRIGFYQNTTAAAAASSCWVMVSGVPTIKIAASAAKAVQLYTTNTSGTLDSTVATGSQYPVRGVFLLTTNGGTASTGAAQAPYPTVGPMTALL